MKITSQFLLVCLMISACMAQWTFSDPSVTTWEVVVADPANPSDAFDVTATFHMTSFSKASLYASVMGCIPNDQNNQFEDGDQLLGWFVRVF